MLTLLFRKLWTNWSKKCVFFCFYHQKLNVFDVFYTFFWGLIFRFYYYLALKKNIFSAINFILSRNWGFHSAHKNLISYWSCHFTNFNVSFEKHSSFVNIHVFCFECPSRFWLQLQGEGTYQKKLDVKTFLFSSSNRGTQRYNGRESRLSKLLSLVQKQLQKYNIREYKPESKRS